MEANKQSSFLKIHPALYLADTSGKGRGVFTNMDINPSIVVETSSVLVMSAADRVHLDATPLYNYIFEWGSNSEQCCTAWGYISMYNHSYDANCEYFMDFDACTVMIKTVKPIQKGEELTINYNGDYDNPAPLWFEAR